MFKSPTIAAHSSSTNRNKHIKLQLHHHSHSIPSPIGSHSTRPSRRPRRLLQTTPQHTSSTTPLRRNTQNSHQKTTTPSTPSRTILPPPPSQFHSLLIPSRFNHNFNKPTHQMDSFRGDKFTTHSAIPSHPNNHIFHELLHDPSYSTKATHATTHSNHTHHQSQPLSSSFTNSFTMASQNAAQSSKGASSMYLPPSSMYLPPSSIPLTHLKFSHRPRVITLDVTGTLFSFTDTIGALYSKSAKKVGINVTNPDLIQTSFLKAYQETADQYPNFGANDLPSSRHWWYQVVKKTFQYAGYNLPYHQQDILFEQIYSDFGQAETYTLYNDVLPFLNFIQKYNQFVSNPANRKKLYKAQRNKLKKCLTMPIGMPTDGATAANLASTGNNHESDGDYQNLDPMSSPSSQEELEEICYNTHGYLHYNPILVGIVTNSDSRYQDGILPALGLHKYLNFYVISDRESAAKPSRVMFDRAVIKANQYSNYLGHNCENKKTVSSFLQQAPADHTNVDENDQDQDNQSNTFDHSSSTSTSNWGSILPEDVLHIGDNLIKDVYGAHRADLDQVYLLRDKDQEELLGKFLEHNQKHKPLSQEPHFSQSSRNKSSGSTSGSEIASEDSSAYTSSEDQDHIPTTTTTTTTTPAPADWVNVITGDNHSHHIPAEFQQLFSLTSIFDDYEKMQNTTASRIINNPQHAELAQEPFAKNITTFRNLLQVRDAYFYDVVDIIDRM